MVPKEPFGYFIDSYLLQNYKAAFHFKAILECIGMNWKKIENIYKYTFIHK